MKKRNSLINHIHKSYLEMILQVNSFFQSNNKIIFWQDILPSSFFNFLFFTRPYFVKILGTQISKHGLKKKKTIQTQSSHAYVAWLHTLSIVWTLSNTINYLFPYWGRFSLHKGWYKFWHKFCEVPILKSQTNDRSRSIGTH